MAAAIPTAVRLRAYNVGFGDCLLLSVRYEATAKHVLIDFGSTSLPKTNGPRDLKQVAEQIRADTEGKLTMVVATHRHTDHISGFAGPSGRIIASLKPDLVVQPWTEDPELQPDATDIPLASQHHRHVAALSSMQIVAEQIALARKEDATRTSRGAGVARQLGFLGETNIKNHGAVAALQELGQRRVYVHHGSTLPTGRLLPGVTISVLGPPTIEQSAAIARQTARDPAEYWHIAATRARAASHLAGEVFPHEPRVQPARQEARRLIPRLNRLDLREQLEVVRILDTALNNTSVILLFEIAGHRLLFPGDAQIENWRYALRGGEAARDNRARLSQTDIYKVGHHGSLNATPKKLLWSSFHKRGLASSDRRLVTVLSTLAGKHGSDAHGTEVPRKPLLEELRTRSTLVSTADDSMPAGTFWRDVDLDLQSGSRSTR
jgi:beta-lactamase superfamily II metal-dependent hydrolase